MIKKPFLFTTLIFLFTLFACSKHEEPKLNEVKEINTKIDSFIGVWGQDCGNPIFTVSKTDVLISDIKIPFEIKEDKLLVSGGTELSISSDGLIITRTNSSDPNKSEEFKKCK